MGGLEEEEERRHFSTAGASALLWPRGRTPWPPHCLTPHWRPGHPDGKSPFTDEEAREVKILEQTTQPVGIGVLSQLHHFRCHRSLCLQTSLSLAHLPRLLFRSRSPGLRLSHGVMLWVSDLVVPVPLHLCLFQKPGPAPSHRALSCSCPASSPACCPPQPLRLRPAGWRQTS